VTGVLVIGYGNPLSGRRRCGWSAAELLAEDPRAAGRRRSSICHQLGPGAGPRTSAEADLWLLIDASAEVTGGSGGVEAGAVEVRTIPVAHDERDRLDAVHVHFSPTILNAVRLLQLSGCALRAGGPGGRNQASGWRTSRGYRPLPPGRRRFVPWVVDAGDRRHAKPTSARLCMNWSLVAETGRTNAGAGRGAPWSLR